MEEFIKDFTDPKTMMICLSIGVRKSGKTYNMLKLIELSFKYNIYQRYIICCPVYCYEETDSYKPVKDFKKKNPKQIDIFNKFSFLITQDLMNNADKIHKSKEKILLFIDDVALSKESLNHDNFNDLLTVARHIGISVFINFHSLTSARVISPYIRQQQDYILIYKINAYALIEKIHEEYLSLSDENDKKIFIEKYRKHMKTEYNSILVDCRRGSVDWRLKHLDHMIKKVERIAQSNASTHTQRKRP